MNKEILLVLAKILQDQEKYKEVKLETLIHDGKEFNLFLTDPPGIYVIFASEKAFVTSGTNAFLSTICQKFDNKYGENLKILFYNEKLKVFTYTYKEYMFSKPQ